MMAAILAHFVLGLGIAFEAGVAVCYTVVAVILSLRNRRRTGWHWPGARLKDILGALAASALIIFFFGAILPGASPLNPRIFPFLAAGFNFLVFAILSGLKIVFEKEDEFLRYCGEFRPTEARLPVSSPLPFWKRLLWGAFQVYFLAIWIGGVGFFWQFNAAYNHGTPQPTPARTEILTSHGHSVYITPEQRRRIDLLEHLMIYGIPSVLISGFLLHLLTRANTPRD